MDADERGDGVDLQRVGRRESGRASGVGRRENLSQDAARHIRDLILSGGLRPGERIDQDSIAADLELSRLPIREALLILESEGLVDNRARRGSYVAAITPDDIRDHFEMYGLLSGLAARHAVGALGEEEIDEIEQIAKQIGVSQDPEKQDQLNFRFHQLINRAGSSRRLLLTLRMLSQAMPTHFFDYDGTVAARSLEEHSEIVTALRDRDADQAAEAMRDHFQSVGAIAVDMLKSSGFWDDTTVT